jgi:hypothetical protein
VIVIRIICALAFVIFMLTALSLNHLALLNYGMPGLFVSGSSILVLLLGILRITEPSSPSGEEW